MIEISKRIDKWLKDNNLSTTTINNETGISKSNIRNWCNGKTLPSTKALITLYEKYNFPIHYILTGEIMNNKSNQDDEMLKELINIAEQLNTTNKAKLIVDADGMFQEQNNIKGEIKSSTSNNIKIS